MVCLSTNKNNKGFHRLGFHSEEARLIFSWYLAIGSVSSQPKSKLRAWGRHLFPIRYQIPPAMELVVKVALKKLCLPFLSLTFTSRAVIHTRECTRALSQQFCDQQGVSLRTEKQEFGFSCNKKYHTNMLSTVHRALHNKQAPSEILP